jgi:hypothetical protein
MLAQIRNRSRRITRLVLLLVSGGLASCATKQPPPLIADPTAKTDSALPWNQQERWENEGQLGQLGERYDRDGNSRH